MKKIIAFISLIFLACSFSLYQGCKKHTQTCILLNKVITQPFNLISGQAMVAADSVPAGKFAINITLDVKEFSCRNPGAFSFISAAYAHDVNANYLYYDTLKSITITCLQPFDSTHAAGIPLNEYFSVPLSLQHEGGFVKSYNHPLIALPYNEMFYEFRVTVELSGGTLYDTLLPPIKLLL